MRAGNGRRRLRGGEWQESTLLHLAVVWALPLALAWLDSAHC